MNGEYFPQASIIHTVLCENVAHSNVLFICFLGFVVYFWRGGDLNCYWLLDLLNNTNFFTKTKSTLRVTR